MEDYYTFQSQCPCSDLRFKPANLRFRPAVPWHTDQFGRSNLWLYLIFHHWWIDQCYVWMHESASPCRVAIGLQIRAAGNCVISLSVAGTTPAAAGRRPRDTSGTAPGRHRHWRRQAGEHKKVPAGGWAARRHARPSDAEDGLVGPERP
jgi:hypothetical protein